MRSLNDSGTHTLTVLYVLVDMIMTIYTVIFIAIVVIISTNIVKNHGKDCVAIDVFGYTLTSGELVVIAMFWPLAIVYLMLWLVWKAFYAILQAIGIIRS